MRLVRTWLLLTVALVVPWVASGCVNLLSMGVFTPIPIPPWVTERMEEKYCIQTDFETPVMPAIPPGHRPLCEDEPDLARVLRAMPKVPRGIPYVYEEFRDDIELVNEKLVDVIDPPRFYPLIGPAQLHHCHWKCTVFYTETIQSGYPFPFRCKRRRTEVIYIDLDHLHLVACTPEQLQLFARDMGSGLMP
jgi:hypothetical protein